MKLLILITCAFTMLSCQSIPTRVSKVNFSTFESLQLNETSMALANDLLGTPLEIRDADSENQVAWDYYSKDPVNWYSFTLFFNKRTKSLSGKFWWNSEYSPIKTTLDFGSKYPDAKFQVVEKKQCGHALSYQSYFVEPKLGVVAIYETKTKIIESISWSEPTERFLASVTQEECPSRSKSL